jgi:hypothetical protein
VQKQPPKYRTHQLTVIKALRLANKWSLRDMEEKGFKRFTWAHWEMGDARLNRESQILVGGIFKIRPHFIFDRFGYPVKLSDKDILAITMAKRRKGDFV